MTFRTFVAPLAPLTLLALLSGLAGCSLKSAPPAPAGAELVAAGNAAYEQKDYAKACEDLSKAGGGADALARAGDACARSGMARAQQAFKAALAADAGHVPALEGLGVAAYASGDLAQARDMLEASVKAGGKDPRAALALGDVSLLSGQCDKAQAAYLEAVRRDPTFAPARSRLEACRILCPARKGAPAAATGAAPGVTGYSGSNVPSTSAPAANPKEPGKTKAAPKTIDLNDI